MNNLIIILILIIICIIIFVLINNNLKNKIMAKNKIIKKNSILDLKFNYNVSEIEQIKKDIIKTKKEWLNTLKTNKNIESKDFLYSYLYLLDKYNYIYNSISILQYVSDDEKVKNASVQFTLDLAKENQKIFENKDNYKIFKYYLDQELSDKQNDPILKKIINKILLIFENNGVHLEQRVL